MTLFNGLEEILKCVIENTAYLSKNGEDQNISDEQRYDNAMKALFGDAYTDESLKPPTGFSFADMLWIHNQRCDGHSFEGAIKQLVAGRLKKPVKPLKRDEKIQESYDKAMNRYEKDQEVFFERIKIHFRRNKNFYERMRSSSVKGDVSAFLEESLDGLEREKQTIFEAMRKAGWPI